MPDKKIVSSDPDKRIGQDAATGRADVVARALKDAPEYGIPDAESPEVTKEAMQSGLSATEFFAARGMAPPKPVRGRPAGSRNKAPTKEQVTMRLDADLVAAMKATGKGYTTRANAALRAAFLAEAE